MTRLGIVLSIAVFATAVCLVGCGSSDKDVDAAKATVVTPEKAQSMGFGHGRKPMTAQGTTGGGSPTAE